MSRRAWILFAAVSLLWGIPYLFIKIAVLELSPPMVVAGRTAIAAVVLMPVAIATGSIRELRGRYGVVFVLAMVHIAVPFLLITYGEQHITSSLTALLIATQPIMVALLALRFDTSERLTPIRAAGLVVGFAGVALVVGFDPGDDSARLLGAGYVLLAALCYAAAVLLMRRRLVDAPAVALTAATMTITAVLLAPLAVVTAPDHLPSPRALSSLVVLGLLCSALALILFYRLIAVAGAGRASVINYVTPAIAVALGMVVLDEPVRHTTLLGFGLVLAGSWLCTGAAVRAAPRPAADPAQR